MTNIIIEGQNLGKKHQNYNNLLKEIVANKRQVELTPINYDDNDIDNFLKIDIASANRNVDYILEVLKSEDILYASRAIKKSTWLITDDKYSHIINPEYLHSTLSPLMTTKAFNKLIFDVRINIKNQTRSEEFYNYYKDKNMETALKWLPQCSLPFIEQVVESKCNDMKLDHLERLCKLSISILEICVKKLNSYKKCLMEANMRYMKDDLPRFLNLVESTKNDYEFPEFNAKNTKIILREKERIMKNFNRYAENIDLQTFVKEMDSTKIKEFLLELAKDKKMKNLMKFDKIKHFIHRMPKEDRFEFVKKFFIEKTAKQEPDQDMDEECCEDETVGYQSYGVAMKCAMMEIHEYHSSTFSNIYRWYIFSPFEVAFPELIKLIRAESSFSERISMFLVLLGCAKNNKDHIKTLLTYYQKKHINEPSKYKIKFIDALILKTNVHTYEEDTWKVLNEIFYSLEVYNVNRNEPDVNIQSCIRSIITYNVLHDLAVPATVENKFVFETYKNDKQKLTPGEKDKLFKYLFNFIKAKIQNLEIKSEANFNETINNLQQLFDLLKDWNKKISDFPFALDTVKELIKVKKQNSWDHDLSSLYNTNKPWRKYMFEESLELYATEDACLNALKHNPELLTRYSKEILKLQEKDSVSLAKLLKKIRTYWSQSLAEQWSSAYLTKLKESNETGYKGLIKGLCVLLPQKRFLEIVKEYAPNENKVNWSEVDETELTLRKLIAKNMYLARPMLPPECVLWYAKGDYLQFALPSFNAVFDNLCQEKMQQHLPELLRAPVSLQKHGIRVIYHKQKSSELYSTLQGVWKTNQNKTIRATVFKQVFKLMCSEKDPKLLENIWNTLSGFIEDLTPDENKIIYTTLGKVSQVPREIRPKFCIKSYNFLKTLPTKANCEQIIKDVIDSTVNIMEDLNTDFISNILMEDFDKKIVQARFEHSTVLGSFLLSCKTKEIQVDRFNKVFLPLIDRIFELWNEKEKNKFIVRENFDTMLTELIVLYVKYVGAKKMNNPIAIFEEIMNKMESKLSVESNYILLRKWKLMLAFAKAVDTQADKFTKIEIPESEYESRWWSDGGKYNDIFYKTNKLYAKMVIECLRDDIEKLFPSIYGLFSDAYSQVEDNLTLESEIRYDILKQIADLDTDFIPGQIFIINRLPGYMCFGKSTTEKIIKEVQKKLMNHPASEVKTHYFAKYKFEPLFE